MRMQVSTRGACRELWRRPGDMWDRLCFQISLTFCSPKQTWSNWFCSHTVHAPENPKPLRSHSMASKPWMVRRAVLNELSSACSHSAFVTEYPENERFPYTPQPPLPTQLSLSEKFLPFSKADIDLRCCSYPYLGRIARHQR